MKKRFFALLLTVAILASMVVIPTHAEAVTDNVTAITETCPCGCGAALADVNWQPYKGEAHTGHYYLAGDYSQTEEESVISGNSVVLDLRGYTLTTAKEMRLFTVNGYLGILDSVGGGRLTSKTANSRVGGIIRVADNETEGSLVELYSGTIMPRTDATISTSGGIIGVGDGATFRMYGGMLMGGNTDTSGGAINAECSTATIEILGGSIVGCRSAGLGGSIYSNGGTTVLKNCTVLGGSNGGNIYQNAGSLTVENSTIANGISNKTSQYCGGNISILGGADVKITDSVIYGGYSLNNGGNLCLGWSTAVIKNTRIYGGTCEGMGANVAVPNKAAKVTLDGCTVDGGMDNVIGTLILKGATKISLNNGGLDLTEQTTKTTTATGLTAGAEVYVSGNKTLTGSLDYIKPALRTTLTASGTTITAAPAAGGETAGFCPHCDTKVAWQPYGTAGATHTYLTADMADFAEVTVESDLCIDLAGFSITATGRAFNVASTGTLAILNSGKVSSITGSGVNGENGGVILNAGTLYLDGGKYTYAAAEGVVPTAGGIVYSSGSLEAYGTILDAGAYANTAANGGAICTDGGVTVTMKGGKIIGGTADNGGGAYFSYNNTVTIDAVTFTGGTAGDGGNLCAKGTSDNLNGTLTLTGVSILEGKATGTYAGNLYMGRYNSCSITSSYLAGGSAARGGNFSLGVSTNATLTQCIIEGGSSTTRGGQVDIPGAGGYLTLDRCLMTNGTAPAGGNIYVDNGTCTVNGGEISYGTATGTCGGNIYASTTKKTGVTLTADTEGNVPLVCRGTAADKGGNLCAEDTVNIDAVQFAGGTAPNGGNDLYVNSTSAALTLGSGVTGDVYMNASSDLLTEEVYGGAISNITCQESDANFYMDGYSNCGTILKNSTLYVATTSVVSKGVATWYASNAEAVAACEEGGYVKLYTDNDLVLTKDLYVDINGQTVNVSGSFTLYGMDSTGDGYTEPAGCVTLTDTALADVTDAPNGNTYITVENRFHRLGMAITGVSIRPSANGMYYTAKWSCDDTLKGMIASYGVVASTEDMPDSNFTADEGNLWTAFTKDSFVSGSTKNGAVLSNIMSETVDDNDTRGKAAVYAKAYITFTDGTSLISNDNIHYSLYDVMKNLDRLIMEKPTKYRKFNLSARNFYEIWKNNGMDNWNLTKIPTPEADDVIDVLMVGNSWCYYYADELYALGQAAGIDIRVCNLYYSGCPLVKHYNWWVGGNSYYQYYETFHDGRLVTNGVSLEWGLAQHEWDVISLNYGTTDLRQPTAEDMIENSGPYATELFGYFGESFPNADLFIHQAWALELGYDNGSTISIQTVEEQMAFTDKARQCSTAFCEDIGVKRINTGDAWELYRTTCDEAGIEHNLTARLGSNNNQGDKSHDGDIGGGQYLNALVWFEILTGLDCRETTYIPTYTYGGVEYPMSETMAEMLQEAAHKAVTEILPTYPENAN